MCPVEPLPLLALDISPGLALASATNSATVRAGTLGPATKNMGALQVRVMGVKSFTGS